MRNSYNNPTRTLEEHRFERVHASDLPESLPPINGWLKQWRDFPYAREATVKAALEAYTANVAMYERNVVADPDNPYQREWLKRSREELEALELWLENRND